jgi:hypothetical protein
MQKQERSSRSLNSEAPSLDETAVARIILKERKKSTIKDQSIREMSPSKVLRYLQLNANRTPTLFQTIFTAQHQPLQYVHNKYEVNTVPGFKMPYIRYTSERTNLPQGFDNYLVRIIINKNEIVTDQPYYEHGMPLNLWRWVNFKKIPTMMWRFKQQNKNYLKRYKPITRAYVYSTLWNTLYRLMNLKTEKLEARQGRKPINPKKKKALPESSGTIMSFLELLKLNNYH